MTTPIDLKALYPYQFAESPLGVAFTRGWLPLMIQLCTDVDVALGQNKRGFHWREVKEKFGSLRAVFRLSDGTFESEPELVRSLFALTNATERASETVCTACGQPGLIDSQSGYLLTLCSTHRSHLVVGIPVAIWYDVEEDPL